ncbi:uncharacterized protein LOC129231637 [Uloborus diversus]|uniref:uncharacterized protein LOC129231637 n=1 Tax=Uloborus diversus TaxID=327109 RepID=UPI00240A59F0|nr:uncharacterized protein LOC129231637 [Uloborus diversus]
MLHFVLLLFVWVTVRTETSDSRYVLTNPSNLIAKDTDGAYDGKTRSNQITPDQGIVFKTVYNAVLNRRAGQQQTRNKRELIKELRLEHFKISNDANDTELEATQSKYLLPAFNIIHASEKMELEEYKNISNSKNLVSALDEDMRNKESISTEVDKQRAIRSGQNNSSIAKTKKTHDFQEQNTNDATLQDESEFKNREEATQMIPSKHTLRTVHSRRNYEGAGRRNHGFQLTDKKMKRTSALQQGNHTGRSETKEVINKRSMETDPISFKSVPITTPYSHMNDPPFHGPNVPSERDLVNEKENEKKEIYTTHKTFLLQSLHLDNNWKEQAREIFGLAWDCHCYITGSLFLINAFYSFISLLRVNTFNPLLRTNYYLPINGILCLTCVLRSLYLLYDPYNFKSSYPVLVSRILLHGPMLCLTASFNVLMFFFLDSTKTRLFLPTFQKPFALTIVIIMLFVSYVTIETIAGTSQQTKALLLFCKILIIAWSSLSSVCYFAMFKKLRYRGLRKQREMTRVTFTKLHIDGALLPKKLPKPTLSIAINLLLLTAIFQLLLSCLIPYSIMFVNGMHPKSNLTDVWLWWGYQLSCRVLELAMCVTMSFIATQPQEHYEISNNTFYSILRWLPCSSFHKEEVVDFEAHTNNYANLQGFNNLKFSMKNNSFRLQTNSLPTFRTCSAKVADLPLKALSSSGRHTNYASAFSLLSYYRSKGMLSRNDGFEDTDETPCNRLTLSSDRRNNSLRPTSMLYKDGGFIRFREANDPEQPMEMSDDDDKTNEIDTSLDDADSTKANAGSSFHSLLKGDIVQNTPSPFFQRGYKGRFRKLSRVSIETTDYSADISSDQMSNVINLKSGLSTSAADIPTKKYGSTCSSESAANSFDVTFFLNRSLNMCSAYRSETEDDKTSSVEGHEIMLKSVSPVVKRSSSARFSLNLNLQVALNISDMNDQIVGACVTEDITPDSAVYVDLNISNNNTTNPNNTSYAVSSSDIFPDSKIASKLSERTSEKLPSTFTFNSHSLDELRTINSYMTQDKKNSSGILDKLRNSTFSLSNSMYGYEPLEYAACSNSTSFSLVNRKKLSISSDDQKLLPEEFQETSAWTPSVSPSFRDSGIIEQL